VLKAAPQTAFDGSPGQGFACFRHQVKTYHARGSQVAGRLPSAKRT
jgi:hypothetical protein